MNPNEVISNVSMAEVQSGPSAPTPAINGSQVAAHRSRWGWHACDYATYREVKEYHRLLYRSLRAHHRWVAWDRKTVHKAAVEPASECCRRHLVGDVGWFRPHRFPGQVNHKYLSVYTQALAAYRAIRTPAGTPELAAALAVTNPLPGGWRLQLEDLRAYYQAHPEQVKDDPRPRHTLDDLNDI